MAAHEQSPAVNEEAPPEEQEQSTPTYEDRLAGKLEEGAFTQEQQLSLQATLALIFGASTHALEIKHSLDLLRGEININKLVTDPKYKAEIERAVQLTNRYGRIVKKGNLVDIVPRVETALARVEILHEQTSKVKKNLSPQYEIEMRQAYGLNDEQLEVVREKALERIKENPKLSMKDALRMEARELLVKTVEKEVKDDKSVKRGDRKKEIEKRIDERDKKFLEHPQTARIYDVENQLCGNITNRGIEEIKQTLGVEPKLSGSTPTTAPTQPTTIPVSQPTPPLPIVIPPLPIPSPPISIPRFSMPSFSLPSGIKNGLGGLFGGLGKTFGGVGKALGSIFGKGGLFSKAFNLANTVGKQLINRGLDAIAPGLGLTIGKINDAIKGIIGIDIEGTIVKGTVIVLAILAGVVIIVPLIIGIGVFSYITGNNPITLSSSNERIISWNEFNNRYLTINTAGYALGWQQFEKNNLTIQKQFLSLEKISPEP